MNINIREVKKLCIEVESFMPWVNGISSKEQYEDLLEVMDQLVEDYDSNQTLINMIFPILERFEEEAEQFKAFNERVDDLDQGVAMLTVIIDQHQLTYSDLPEIGSKSLVSQIINGHRSLTLRHIKGLSERFGIPKYMFV